MASHPQFVASYRQDVFYYQASFYNTPQCVLTPGESGTRLHGIALNNESDHDIEVRFGYALKLTSECHVNIVPGTTPASNPWTMTRLDEKSFITDGWFVGSQVTLTQDAQHRQNRGDFRVTSVTATMLSFAPKTDIVQELGVTVNLWRWQPFWSIMVPRRAGYDKNPSVSGLDLKQMPWLDLLGDRWLVVTKPLWMRLPYNVEGNLGSITLTCMGGDY